MSEETQAKSCPIAVKDLLIPVAIVLAGALIGFGLYSGGTPGQSPSGVVAAPQAPEDNTSLVAPITEADHTIGNINAPIKIVEYSDFDCPFCARFHDTMKVVVEKYGPENVVWAYRHFPIEGLHPQAPLVSLASECVAEVGGSEAFWSFADGYYAARGAQDRTPSLDLVNVMVAEAGVAGAEYDECFESQRLRSNVEADLQNGVDTGGQGTPWSILIGPSGKTYPINGALPIEAIEQLIAIAQEEA
jgi:protein-disulfide isomerase